MTIPAILTSCTHTSKIWQERNTTIRNDPRQLTTLSSKDTKHIQSTTGLFLFYGREIDYTILPALNDIASAQSKPIEQTKDKAQQMMDYINTYLEAYIRFYARNMVLTTCGQRRCVPSSAKGKKSNCGIFPPLRPPKHNQTSKTEQSNPGGIQNFTTCGLRSRSS